MSQMCDSPACIEPVEQRKAIFDRFNPQLLSDASFGLNCHFLNGSGLKHQIPLPSF